VLGVRSVRLHDVQRQRPDGRRGPSLSWPPQAQMQNVATGTREVRRRGQSPVHHRRRPRVARARQRVGGHPVCGDAAAAARLRCGNADGRRVPVGTARIPREFESVDCRELCAATPRAGRTSLRMCLEAERILRAGGSGPMRRTASSLVAGFEIPWATCSESAITHQTEPADNSRDIGCSRAAPVSIARLRR
jgi:hypothetical protein